MAAKNTFELDEIIPLFQKELDCLKSGKKPSDSDYFEAIRFNEIFPKEGKKWDTKRAEVHVVVNGNVCKRPTFYVDNVTVKRGVADPNRPDDLGNKWGKNRPYEKKIDVACNKLYEFLRLFQEIRDTKIPMLTSMGKLKNWSASKFHPTYKTTSSGKSYMKEEYRNKEFVDANGNPEPRMVLVYDFTVLEKQTNPNSVVTDFKTGVYDEENSKIKYSYYTIDGKFVDETNAHQAITNGSTLEEVYFRIEPTVFAESSDQVSNKLLIKESVVNTKKIETGLQKIQPKQSVIEKLKKLQQSKNQTESSEQNTNEVNSEKLMENEDVQKLAAQLSSDL